MKKFLFNTISLTRQYLYSITIIIIVAAICYTLSAFMGYRVTAFILLLTVSLLAVVFDIFPVLLAAVLSAFLWDFFFIPPRYTIHVDNTEDSILLIMYFIIAMINAGLTYKIRQIEKAARLKEERANSVKLYNTILNSLSHELRTPLAAIIGATDNLQTNNNLTIKDRELLIAEISKASLRLNQQVENLLNISRLESGHIQPKNDWCDIVEIVYGVVKRVEENNPGREIGINISQDLPLISIDKGMFEQVIYNLLNNAAIHTSSDCSIHIVVACHADLLEVIIEDSGTGFKNINPNDVFNKHSRSRPAQPSGSGLGLSIVKGFTDALRGNIELKNRNGGGARFLITIPVNTTYFKTTET